jgi:hypothetical protein
LLFAHDGSLEWFKIVDGRVTQWEVLPKNPEQLALHLGLLVFEHAGQLQITVGEEVNEVIGERLREGTPLEFAQVSLPSAHHASISAARAAWEGSITPWIQLHRDALGEVHPYRQAEGAIRAVAAAAILLCVCLCGGMLWRANNYRRQADSSARALDQLYAHVFDGHQPTGGVDVASRLSSEERRLRLLSGHAAELPMRVSALYLLQRLLSDLPRDTPCQVDDLRISPERLSIEGTAPSHAEAAAFAASLSAGNTFQIDPPRTEQRSGVTGVSMSITATTMVQPELKGKP